MSTHTDITIRIYLNEGADHFFGFRNQFANAPALREAIAFTAEAGDVTSILNGIYHELNVDSPSAAWAAAYRAGRNRSLSVGDVVTVGEVAFAVASFGFDRISTDDLTEAIERGSVDLLI